MNPWLQRLYWTSAIVLFAGLPISKALSSIGIGLVGLCAVIELFRNPKSIKTHLPILGFGVLLVWYSISAFYSESFLEGLHQAFRQHAFLSVPLCFWALSDWLSSRLPKLIDLFIGSVVFHCLLTLVFFGLTETTVASIAETIPLLKDYEILTDRLKFGLYTPLLDRLHFAYLIGFGILYLSYDLIHHGTKAIKIIQGLILLLSFALIGARGAQLSLLIALGIGGLSYAIAYLKRLNLSPEIYQQRQTAAVVTLLIVVLTTPYLAYKTIPAVQKRYDQLEWEMRLIDNGDYLKEEYQYFTSLTRIRSWKNGWNIIKEHSVLGVGIGDYRGALEQKNAEYADKVPVHNQNFFLYIWGAAGIFSLLCFVGAIWVYTRSFWKGKQHSFRHLALAYMIFVIVSCMIDAFLKYHIGSISVMTFLATLFLISKSGKTVAD